MKTVEAESNQAIFLQQQIDLYTEELVKLADETLSENRMKKIKEVRKGLKTSQLNNLLGLALESPSVATIRNWVHYQMGRDKDKKSWRKDGFGDSVLQDLDKIRVYAKDAVSEAFSDAEEKTRKRQFSQAYIKMVRLYTGYLLRWFVARGGQGK